MNTGLLLHTLLGLLLLVIPAGLLYLLERPMLKTFGIAIVRMIIQLAVLCLVVWGLIRVDSPWLLILWLVAIAAYSGWLVIKRCRKVISGPSTSSGTANAVVEPVETPPVKARGLYLSVSAGLLIGVSLIAFWLLGLVFPVRIFDPHWFVPVTALLMGHATAMMIRGLSTYLSALQADEQQYEFLRGNGLAHFKALLPFLRRSLLAVISPTVANLSVLGLTSMPLLLVGILLGGISPFHAYLLMIGMMVGCVSASVLSLALSIFCYELSQRHIRQTAA
jgi:putative ABC transport system permease protein